MSTADPRWLPCRRWRGLEGSNALRRPTEQRRSLWRAHHDAL